MFTQRMWMIPLAHLGGLAAAALAILLVQQGRVAPWWLLAWVAGHAAGSIGVSVGLHRYFTHGAFRCSPRWQAVLGFLATIPLQGSPAGWSMAHQAHHDHSDGPGDPHFTGWTYLLWKRYRAVPMASWRLRMLVRDPVVAFTHRYALLIVGAWVWALLVAGGITGTGVLPLVFGYLAPLGSTHLVGGIHQVISHWRRAGGRDLPLLEWVLPAMGEWHHRFHHDHPRAWRMGYRWWHLDIGAAFIRCIKA